MKVSELFETVLAAGDVLPITVKDNGEGSFTVNSAAKNGPTLDAIFKVWNSFHGKRGVTTKSKAGLELDAHRMLKNRPNGVVIAFKDAEGAKEKLEAAVEKAVAAVQREVKSNASYKAKAPERKKAASAANAVYAKADKEARDKKYGKGTWERITYKQEGGDDGYQYVLRVDRRAVMNGLTRNQAEGEKRMLAAKLAKEAGLGEYAKKK